MLPKSLSFRLLLTSAIMALVLLVTAGLLLAYLFQQAIERNFDARLRAVLDGLPAAMELAEDGTPSLTSQISDTRFSLPWSGWYWKVTGPAGKNIQPLGSESLQDEPLEPDAALLAKRDQEGIASFYLTDSKGQQLRAMQQNLQLFGSEDPYSFIVAGNFDELKAEITAFRRALYGVLAVLGLGLVLGILIQLRVALRPLQVLSAALSAIRSGKAEKLEGSYPTEIQPVANELNMLIQANSEIVERARTQVGNLAHALKTPLSVLTNEAADNKSTFAVKVMEQTRVMRDQVSLYLDRARRAARAQTKGQVSDVEPVLQALARTIMRINRERGVTISVSVQPGLKFRGESQDLEEMAGNLIDNASKWAGAKVHVEATRQASPDETGRLWLTVRVDDDGPGLPPDKWEEALQRGKRLDETKPGSGLGLSIVTETAAMYGGGVTLNKATLGGLRADLKLPAVSD
jgi:signal transduction histidine kinase